MHSIKIYKNVTIYRYTNLSSTNSPTRDITRNIAPDKDDNSNIADINRSSIIVKNNTNTADTGVMLYLLISVCLIFILYIIWKECIPRIHKSCKKKRKPSPRKENVIITLETPS